MNIVYIVQLDHLYMRILYSTTGPSVQWECCIVQLDHLYRENIVQYNWTICTGRILYSTTRPSVQWECCIVQLDCLYTEDITPPCTAIEYRCQPHNMNIRMYSLEKETASCNRRSCLPGRPMSPLSFPSLSTFLPVPKHTMTKSAPTVASLMSPAEYFLLG